MGSGPLQRAQITSLTDLGKASLVALWQIRDRKENTRLKMTNIAFTDHKSTEP